MCTIGTLTLWKQVQPLGQRHVLAGLVLVATQVFVCSSIWAQELNSAFHRFEGEHIELITDVAPTPEVRDLTAAFDAGVRHWADLFHADAAKVATWKVKAYIMTERKRFENSGLISPTIRTFREGHQEGDLILCKEQPSAYYRRHLLLHEGVHWFMEKALGGYGPGWWMEGIAEWQSTHQWDGKDLVCGLMPKTREQVPYWGRFEWIQQDLAANEAPSLPILFQRAKDLHRVDSTYGWSWMAATFFANHPRYKDQFYKRLSEKTDYSNALNKDVMGWIGEDMKIVQAEFNGFVAEMDYGVDPAKAIVDMKSTKENAKAQLQIYSPEHWRLYSKALEAKKTYKISSDGIVNLEIESNKLETTPNGLTLRYVHAHPIGQLIAAMIPQATSLEKTIPWTRTTIGKSARLQPESDSWLLFRFNDDDTKPSNPSGSYNITIENDR